MNLQAALAVFDNMTHNEHFTAPSSPPPPEEHASARKPDWLFLRQHPAHMIAIGFGSGLSPKAPGTAGTLFAWAIFALLYPWLNDLAWGILLLLSLLVGVWACQRTATDLQVQDPGSIVWDEIIAFWLVLWLIMPTTFWGQCAAFALFRLFDALKPGPVRWADKAFKGWGYKGAIGIILDDLVAAFLTLLIFAIWRFFF